MVPILLTTSLEAHRDVTDGIGNFTRSLGLGSRHRRRASVALRAAARQLHRTYLTLVWEAQRVCTLSPGKLGVAIEALKRRSLVPRVHQGRGAFAVVERACGLLQRIGAQEPQLVLPKRWVDRELHLFGLLVPLASYAEELARELQSLVEGCDPQTLQDRLERARREMEPVLRLFCLTTEALKRFIEQLTQPRR